MTIFLLCAPADRPDLESAITQAFQATDVYKLAAGQWLIANNELTTQGIVEKIGAQQGALGNVAAFAIANYWGYHGKNLWEWLRIKSG
jgi:hypothetical protein